MVKLQAYPSLTAIVPSDRIVNYVPQRPVFPYVYVQSAGERPFNTIGMYGSVAGLVIRMMSQYRGDDEVESILGEVKGCLDGQPLTVAGYPSVKVVFQNITPLTDFSTVDTREWVAEFDVRVHQA